MCPMWLCSRCVKGEGEIEKLQSKMVELRRKLDDTTAAMQELGRENQSLQVSEETPEELMGLKYRYVGRSQKFVLRIKSEPLIVSPAVGTFSDQAVTVSDQEVGRGSRGAELHGLWEGLLSLCQEGKSELTLVGSWTHILNRL